MRELVNRLLGRLKIFNLPKLKKPKSNSALSSSIAEALYKWQWKWEGVHNLCQQWWVHLPKPQVSAALTVAFKEQSF